MRGGGYLLLIKCEAVGGATKLLVVLRGVHSFKGDMEYRKRRKREKKIMLEGGALHCYRRVHRRIPMAAESAMQLSIGDP